MTIVRFMKLLMMNKAMIYHKKMNLKFKRINKFTIKDLKMIKIIQLKQSNLKIKMNNYKNNKKLNKHLMFQNKKITKNNYLKINFQLMNNPQKIQLNKLKLMMMLNLRINI